jgi:hypothetical protein
MSDDPNDAIVCLRLELHRVRDQFTMVSQVVEFERKENLRLRNEREVLILEVASLKVEVEAQAKRWAESEDLISHYKEQRDEVINDCQCSRLKAEVEELKSQPDPLTAYLYAAELAKDDIKKLKAEVEELKGDNQQLQARCDFYEGRNQQ